MPETSYIEGNLHVRGTLSASSNSPSSGSITDTHVSGTAAISATKMVHQYAVEVELYGPTTTVAALTKLFHIAQSAGTIVAFKAFVITPATGADRTVNVDLQKSTGAGAFATVLSATAIFNNGSSARTLASGTVSSPSYIASDLFQVVVTVAGAAGNQALGLYCVMEVRQNPA